MEDPLVSHLLFLASLLGLLLGPRSQSQSRTDEFALPPEIPGSWPVIGKSFTALASGATYVNLTWVLSLLLNHKHTLNKAQGELDLKIGRDSWVQYLDIDSLPYLRAVNKETLRLCPPGPLSFPEESDEDRIVNGCLIPNGTRLFVNIWKLQRDPRIWSDPNSFLPERFLTGGHVAGLDASGQHLKFIPFGPGRRACPRAAFALQAIHLTLARLLQASDMSSEENALVDMTEGVSITLPKAKPVEVLPRLYLLLSFEVVEG